MHDKIKSLLSALGFTSKKETPEIFSKVFGSLDKPIIIDFNKEEIIYPESTAEGTNQPNGMLVHERTTCNFSAPENFVVLECVCRLLEKGYRPEHIEIEKPWSLGHTAVGGRADIVVSDEKREKTLLIIECKRFGTEYNKALSQLREDGGQLFSYWQQERATKWLCLYASQLNSDGKIEYKQTIISTSDDANVAGLAEKDKTILLYKKASTVPELFTAWDETYHKAEVQSDILFGPDTTAYQIGIAPLRKRDLVNFSPDDQIVNKFEEILRHNNVSDKENAFNRLIALFICKLVDEITKNDDAEVDFQYRVGRDTYETLQDRLMRLHQRGMKEFMDEEIFYVDDDYPARLFKQHLNAENRKKAIESLKKTIRQLKFYSNNDFAFKDVHNEQLFRQNGKILVEVVQLFEKFRIVQIGEHHQFLGDLFEQLLNKGFKQNEGQFFTPTPITRFIWHSLPLHRFTTDKPRIIDYACGAGHFLTEGVNALRKDKNESTDWTRDCLFGVEKDYRLARVAKVALYMNDAGKGNIVFGDGLEQYEGKIENGAFDILVANPPYSVSGFKSHLKLKNNTLKLLSELTNDASEIETLFVERIAQLLKPNGLAAVVLPSSILSNDSRSYIAARKELIENFFIRSIVQFGSKTFGATGTNTVVLFLEKFDEPPKKKELVTDVVDAILDGRDLDNWEDKKILEAYLIEINVTKSTYAQFVGEQKAWKEWTEPEYFAQFKKEFEESTQIKNRRKSNAFKKLSQDEQEKELNRRFYDFVKTIEREKLKIFSLVYDQSTLIINAPSDNAKQKAFLGYEWSNAKGNEGLHMIKEGGELYNPHDFDDPASLNTAIRKTFGNDCTNPPGDYSQIAFLKNLIDFTRTDFNHAIKMTVDKKKVEITSIYPMVKLGDVAEISAGNSAPQKEEFYKNGTHPFFRTADVGNVHLSTNLCTTTDLLNDDGIKGLRLFPKGTILFPKSGASTYLNHRVIMGVDGYVVSHLATIIANNKFINAFFLYELLVGVDARNIKVESGYPSLNQSDLENISIPLPPLEVQREIVKNCQAIDNEVAAANTKVTTAKEKITKHFASLDEKAKTKGTTYKLSNSEFFDISIGRRIVNSEVDDSYDIPVYSANVFTPFGKINKLLIKDFSRDSILWGIDGDWMVALMPRNNQFYPTDHCGVLRLNKEIIEPRYLVHLLEQAGKVSKFSRTYRASIDRIKGLSVSIPSLAEQKRVVAAVEKLEGEIASARAIIAAAPNRKSKILKDRL